MVISREMLTDFFIICRVNFTFENYILTIMSLDLWLQIYKIFHTGIDSPITPLQFKYWHNRLLWFVSFLTLENAPREQVNDKKWVAKTSRAEIDIVKQFCYAKACYILHRAEA